MIWQWLGPLAKEYCTDLVKDSTDILIKLDALMNDGTCIPNESLAFGLDVVALYDSIKHDLALEALDDAMTICRPDWTYGFCSWIKELVSLSFKSAVVKFQDCWYISVNGVPTGGIPSVDLGNITVFYVLKKLIHSHPEKPLELRCFYRFVDDGLGIWLGTSETFSNWFQNFRSQSIESFDLDFTFELTPITSFHQFLDVKFKFVNGFITTDIYRKPTDANRYLDFYSTHPRHTFRSIIYSQGIRYRRIISDDIILASRIDELKQFFINSSYPKKLVDEVLDPIKLLPRILEYKQTKEQKPAMTPWIVSYGPGFSEAQEKAMEVNELITKSDTWKLETPNNIPKLKVVPRRSPNIKDLLFKRRNLALSTPSKATVPCTDPNIRRRGAKCQCCSLVSGSTSVENNGNLVNCEGGNCKTRSLIYAAKCVLCQKVYVGKSVNELRNRVNGHRSSFYDVIRNDKSVYKNCNQVDDENVLGIHLYIEHNKCDRTEFNKSYKFSVLKTCPPDRIRINEQLYIDTLKTLIPKGLNVINSLNH